MVKKLTKAIEESKLEKEKAVSEKEKMTAVFKEVEQKAFAVQENYKKTQEVYIYWIVFIYTTCWSYAYCISRYQVLICEIFFFCSSLTSIRLCWMRQGQNTTT